ncbi:ABC transporter family substrate-binding protein [Aeromicrobium sp. CTD01-1L150]|uniref:ABC transporter family substrate-binding protein n=1 Tax=Aeromicrobium sp. CTD01-1L150 TaxID=3341830 RepID=UPI0035BFB462
MTLPHTPARSRPRPTAAPLLRPVIVAVVIVAMVGGCGLFGGDDEAVDSPSAGAGSDPEELVLTGWSDVAADEVADGGALRIGISTLPATFNPVHADASTGPGGSDLEQLLGPTTGDAVRLTEDGGWEVDEDYAESVEMDREDPLTVRVRLNPDAVWQQGTPITAADMRAYWQAMNGSNDGYRVTSTDGYDDIEAVENGDDEHEYTVRFSTPRSDWPRFVYPRLPRSISGDAKSFNTAFTERPVPSNGPFVVTDIDPESGTITQERNPRWWGRTPKLEQIVWRVATPEVQAEAFDADELDVIDVDATSAPDVDPDLLRRSAGSSWTHLTLGAGSGPLANEDVRQAVALALDRQAVAADAVDGIEAAPSVATSVFTVPGQQGHDEDAEPPERDVEAARELLAGAGYDVGEQTTRDGKQLTLSFPVPEGSSAIVRRAELVTEQLADVGIAVDVTQVPQEDFAEQVFVPRDFDLVTFSWDAQLLGVASAQSRYRPVDSADNVTGVASGSAEQWSDAVTALDDDARHEAVSALDSAVLEQHVVVPLAVPPVVLAVRDGVAGYGPSAFEKPDYTRVGFTDVGD